MAGKLVYVFGPDGAGKSTIVQNMAHTLGESTVLHASQPELWPDATWHQEIIANNLGAMAGSPDYQLKNLDRCYALASRLLQADDTLVIIDSDPRIQMAAKAHALHGFVEPLDTIYDQLEGLSSRHIGEVRQCGVHVTVDRGTPEERATTLMQRIEERGKQSMLDPSSIGQARDLVLAFDALETILTVRGAPLVRVATDLPHDPALLSVQVVS